MSFPGQELLWCVSSLAVAGRGVPGAGLGEVIGCVDGAAKRPFLWRENVEK